MTVPHVEGLLPDLARFVAHLVSQYQDGTLSDWQAFSEQVRAFYTPAMMDKVEQVVPGWRAMAVYAEQQTLIHVTSVLTALFLLEEYQQASQEQQALMVWTVLFHDVAKIPQPGGHDYVHAFRSAAITGRSLAQAGFSKTEAYAGLIDQWVALTVNAVVYLKSLQDYIQDNRKLPEIISGIDHLYGDHAAAGLIIKGVLFHLSIVTDPEYPTVAPLTDKEILQYVDAPCFALLNVMMLVDSDGWNLFDPENHNRHRQQTRDVFNRIATLLNLQI